jgi:hypothetical protein
MVESVMTVSRQRKVLGLALLGLLALAGCAKGESTLADTGSGGAGSTAMGTGGMGTTGTGGAAAKSCGNKVIDTAMGEECDGMLLNNATCVSMGFTAGGTLSCDPTTCRYQLTMCKMMPTGMGGNGH